MMTYWTHGRIATRVLMPCIIRTLIPLSVIRQLRALLLRNFVLYLLLQVQGYGLHKAGKQRAVLKIPQSCLHLK